MKTIIDNFIAECGIWGFALLGVLVILFFVQLWYYCVRYGAAIRLNPSRKENDADQKIAPVSFVTAIHDPNYYYVEYTLPAILAQEHPAYEVILVDLSGDPDFGETLKLATMRDERVNVITLAVNPQFPISNKMALNVGIKAAKYENLIISTTDIVAPSPGWFSGISAGFSSAEIVLGYSPLEARKGQWNKMMRTSNTASGMRWVSAAMRGKPYRGTINNLGMTRGVYFGHNGFNHLNLNIGEEDLFVQYISKDTKTRVVVDKEALVQQKQYGGFGWWHRRRLLYSNAYRFYSRESRLYISTELWTRVLFFALSIAGLIMFTPEAMLAIAALVLMRYIIVTIQTIRIGKIFAQRGLFATVGIYDLFSPIYEALIAILRRVKRTPGVWR